MPPEIVRLPVPVLTPVSESVPVPTFWMLMGVPERSTNEPPNVELVLRFPTTSVPTPVPEPAILITPEPDKAPTDKIALPTIRVADALATREALEKSIVCPKPTLPVPDVVSVPMNPVAAP